MKADATTEKEIMKVLQEFNNGFVTKNVQQILDLFDDDANVTFLGSEKGEKAIGRTELEEQLRHLFSRPTTYSFDWRWHLISIENSVVWVVTEGLVQSSSDQNQSSPYRLTMLLVKRENKWLIMHWHGSEPTNA